MKSKIQYLALLFLLLITIATPAYVYAESTIEGIMVGKNIGLIHPNYSTADPGSSTDGNPGPSYYLGLRDEFYIDIDDPLYSAAPFDTMSISDIGDVAGGPNYLEVCDRPNQICPLHGSLWSSTIGRISSDGNAIRNQGFAEHPSCADPDNCTSPERAALFPNSYYPRVGYDGLFRGYMWIAGHKDNSSGGGWIKLSSDTGDPLPGSNIPWSDGTYVPTSGGGAVPEGFIPSERQDELRWGVWVHTEECELIENQADCDGGDLAEICVWNDPNCETRSDLTNGRPLHGNAWSDKFGWIRFDDDTTGNLPGDFEFGVHTFWFPDTSPPVITIGDDDGEDGGTVDGEIEIVELDIDHIWFANSLSTRAVAWPLFAEDPGSGIDFTETALTITRNPADAFENCIDTTTVSNVDDSGRLSLLIPNAADIRAVPIGFCMYTLAGKVVNGAGLEMNIEGLTFYTRAGDFVETSSSLTHFVDATAVADENDSIEHRFTPLDMGSNPIVPVKVRVDVPVSFNAGEPETIVDPDFWVRDAEVTFGYTADFHFDSILKPVSVNPDPPYPIPIMINPGSATYDQDDAPNFTFTDPGTNFYSAQVSAAAPTTSTTNSISLDLISFELDDLALPTITTESGTDSKAAFASTDTFDINDDLATEHFEALTFNSALSIASTAGVDAEVLVEGASATITFTAENNSTTSAIDELSIDSNIVLNNQPGPGNFGEEVLEIRDINLTSLTLPPVAYTDDGNLGRTNPFVPGVSRYEITSITPSDVTLFHDTTRTYHDPAYPFVKTVRTDPDLSSLVDNDGAYPIDGIYNMLSDDPRRELPYDPADDILLDYSDYLNTIPGFSIPASGSPNDSQDFNIDFTVSQFIGEPFDTIVNFSLDQYVAYRMPGAFYAQSAIYEVENLISGLQVKSPGLGTDNPVSGDMIYETGTREFDVIPASTSGKLKEIMRTNAALLSRDITSCINLNTITPLDGSPDTTQDCVREDIGSNTIVSVYEGSNGEVLSIGDGANISLPNNDYTIIVKGGASVHIRSNIYHDPSNSGSFGIIVLSDSNGNGGHVYIDPTPTNVTALLYAEGSILSSSDTTPADGMQLYYGPGAGDTADLKHQLYWKGTIVSRNTIGGAPNQMAPNGINCSTGVDFGTSTVIFSDVSTCARAFDLDYIRRFVPLGVTGFPNEGYVPELTFYSGGGSCTAAQICSDGPLVVTDAGLTTIDYIGNHIDIRAPKDGGLSKSTDSLYVEKINRSTPPGFSITGGFTRLTEIRN